MRRVAADFGPIPEYAGESLNRVAALTEADYPLDGEQLDFLSHFGHKSYVQRFPKDGKDEIDIWPPWQNCSKLWKKRNKLILCQF